MEFSPRALRITTLPRERFGAFQARTAAVSAMKVGQKKI